MTRDPKDVWRDWGSCKINPKIGIQFSDAVNHIVTHISRYDAVGKIFDAPGWVIGAIHYRESDFDFDTWLANGDPLMRRGKPARTTHVPSGLGPASDWTDAASISLRHDGWHSGQMWDIARALIRLESYNGMGYYRHGVHSPYIWSGTNHYKMGKYSSDGVYDPNLVDKQLGCAALAIGLKMHGIDILEKKFA